MRSEKRKYVVDKAKEILRGLVDSGMPDSDSISEEIKEAVRTQEIGSYEGMPCGPSMLESDEVIIVEGRADVVNLLKFGIRNTIAIEGTSIPPAIAKIVKEKTVILFTDGDRGGELIARELLQKAPEIDFFTSAPEGKEVEELTKKEAHKAIRDKIPIEQFLTKIGKSSSSSSKESERKPRDYTRSDNSRRERSPRGQDNRGRDSRGRSSFSRTRETPAPRATIKQKIEFKKILDELVGTRAACILNDSGSVLGKVPVSELESTIQTLDNPHSVIFDGKIDSNLNTVARKSGVKFLVGMEKEELRTSVCILDKNDLGK